VARDCSQVLFEDWRDAFSAAVFQRGVPARCSSAAESHRPNLMSCEKQRDATLGAWVTGAPQKQTPRNNTAHHGSRQRSTPMCGAAEFFAPPAIVALISLALAKQ